MEKAWGRTGGRKEGRVVGEDVLDILLHVLAYADGRADDFVADATRVDGRTPSAAEGVDVATADAAVGDFDVDVGLLPGLGLVLFPVHFALDGVFVFAHPSLEFVVGGHGCGGGVQRVNSLYQGSIENGSRDAQLREDLV